MSKNLGPLFVSASFNRLLQLDPDDNQTVLVGTGSAVDLLRVTGTISGAYFKGDGSQLTNVSVAGNLVSSSNQVVELLVNQNISVNSLTAMQYVISSSVIHATQSYSSGSTVFGNTTDDTHQFTGSVYISGSLYADGSQLTNLQTGSVRWTDVESRPTGLVSSSNQTLSNLAGTDIVSSSTQRTVLGLGPSDVVGFDTLNVTHSFVQGNLRVEGVITAREYVVSSSVQYVTQSYSSGSTVFGNTSDDTHQFTGSLSVLGGITGSISTSSIVNFDSEVSRSVASYGFGSSLPSGVVSSSNQTLAHITGTNIISSSTQRSVLGLGSQDTVTFGTLLVSGSITAQQIIVSSSVYYVTQSYSSGSTIFGNTPDDTHEFTGSLSVSGSITGHINTSSIVNFDSEVSRSVASYGFGGSSISASYAVTASYVQLPSGIVSSSVQTITYLNGSTILSGSLVPSSSFATTASYVQLPPGVVSSSAQTGSVMGLGPTDTVTFGTVQSAYGRFYGNVIIDGVLTAREYVVSSSVMHVTQSYSSGSTVFGDTLNDIHQFTGSVSISGSLYFDIIDGGTY